MSRIENYIKQNTGVLEDLEHLKTKRDRFFKDIKDKSKRESLLKGKDEKYWEKYFGKKISDMLGDVENLNNQVAEILIDKEFKKEDTISVGKFSRLNKKELKNLIKELKIEKGDLKRALKRKEKISTKEIKYTLYETTKYGKLANRFVERLTLYLNRNYPTFFKGEHKALKSSGIQILSKTYDSIVIFSSILTFIGVLFLVLIGSLVLQAGVVSSLIRGVSFAFLGAVAMFGFLYYYPSVVVGSKNKAIKNDLPFVIIHMAAVAGSGAQPISMFNLVLSSGEYKGIESEIRKIVNYVNLFGYSLTNALRTVAVTTPCRAFRELLTGVVATVETGGDLKGYLKSKADDAMNTYKMDRKKYTDTLATYSDIYTGAFIAAPLLFLVTLAIINRIGGQLGSMDVKTLAMIGTFGVIPFLNVAYAIFLSMVQPEV